MILVAARISLAPASWMGFEVKPFLGGGGFDVVHDRVELGSGFARRRCAGVRLDDAEIRLRGHLRRDAGSIGSISLDGVDIFRAAGFVRRYLRSHGGCSTRLPTPPRGDATPHIEAWSAYLIHLVDGEPR